MSDSDIRALSESRAARGATGPRRAWYRLHLSTLVVVLFVLTALVLIMVPGYGTRFLGWSPPQTDPYVEMQEHGWPLVHMERAFVWTGTPFEYVPLPDHPLLDECLEEREDTPAVGQGRTGLRAATAPDGAWDCESDYWEDGGPEWLAAYHWPLWGRIVAIYPLALALNVATAVVICGVVGGAHEWWRRGRNRFWQFHLRDLLVLVLIVSAGLGLWRSLASEAAREAEIVGRLTRLTGLTVFTRFTPTRRCCAPVWLRRLVGLRHLRLLNRVESLGCSGFIEGEVSPAQEIEVLCESASALRHFRALMLPNADDAAIARVAELKSLDSLNLAFPVVSDQGFQSLQRMENLQELEVRWAGKGPQITEAALVPLGRLESLRTLRFSFYAYDDSLVITGVGLEPLAGLPRLEELELVGFSITDEAALVPLGRIKSLRTIRFWGSGDSPVKITGVALGPLAVLPRLEELDLSGFSITDEGVTHLKRMTRLRRLKIADWSLTEAREEELRRALPNAEVEGPSRQQRQLPW